MKLMQNRTVVIGRNPKDGYEYAKRKKLENAAVITSASHRLTILGSFPSSVGEVHITGTAPEGENFDTVLEGIERVLVKNADTPIIEETRSVGA